MYPGAANRPPPRKQGMQKNGNYEFLTQAPVGRVIATMAVPTIISMLVTSLYNIVDTYFVGKISTQATAAVGVVFPVMTVIQAFGFFFGQGSGTYISRSLGAQKSADASKMAATAFFCSLASGTLITALGLIFLEPISRALGSTPTILPLTKEFLGILLLGAPFMTASMTLNNQMRFQGNAFYAMVGVVAGALLNVILVPIFTFTLGLGIRGTAIGTVIGQIVGFVTLLLMSRRSGGIRIRPAEFSRERRFYRVIFKDGTPSLSRQGLSSLAVFLLNLAAVPYGDAAIAGMSIVGRISSVVFAIVIGIGQGFQPMCGFSYGARLYGRVRKGFFFCLQCGVAFTLLCGIPGFICAPAIVDLLRHDPEVVAVGADALRWQIVSWPVAAFITFANMILQTSGRSLSANIVAACRNGICFIPLIIVLPRIIGLTGVEICQAAADLLSFAIALPVIVRYFRSLRRDL